MKPVKKKHKKGLLAAIIILMAAVAIVMSIRITAVTITGSSRYTNEEMTDLLFHKKWDRNTVYRYYTNKFKDHEKIPFIEDYKMIFKSPSEVEVIVYEKSIVGYVSYMGSYMYFDKDGIIVESANEKMEGIPWITGLKFGQIALYKALPVENAKIFEEILNLTQVLSNKNIEVDKIQYNSRQEVTLYIDQMEVVLGNNDHMEEKIWELRDMLNSVPDLPKMRGVLTLDTYDQANKGISFSFEKK